MFIHHRTKGFFLKKTNFGEADQLFLVYTRDFGSVEVLGKSIRKITSKLRQGAELFYLSEIEFIQGKTFKTLTDTILIDKFDNIRKNLYCQLACYRFAQTISNLIGPQEKDDKIWSLLSYFFDELNEPDILPSRISSLYYFSLWNICSELGYKPELYKCFLCQKRILSGKNYFYPKNGSVVCQNCFQLNKQDFLRKKEIVLTIEDDSIKTIRLFLQGNSSIISRLSLSPSIQRNLKKISEEFVVSL